MMTWGEFKQQVEAEGVTDGDEISWIDVGGYGKLDVTRENDGAVQISE